MLTVNAMGHSIERKATSTTLSAATAADTTIVTGRGITGFDWKAMTNVSR